MVNPAKHSSLGGALEESFAKWSREICLVESDRGREVARLTFEEVRARADALAAYLEHASFGAGDRAAIILTNQSKWHIAACAIFHRGGVLIPLDAKLSAIEQLELLEHCRPSLLVIEDHFWRALSKARGAHRLPENIIVIGSRDAAEGAVHWDDAWRDGTPRLVPRSRSDAACVVYSSGTAGRPKGCVLTHENYLEQLAALLELHPFQPGVRYLSILPTNHAIDFMVGFLGPYLCGATVVHLRAIRPELVREAFVTHRITHVALVPSILKNLEIALRARIAALPRAKRIAFSLARRGLKVASRGRPNARLGRQWLRPIHDAFGGALEAIFIGGAPADAAMLRFFHDLGIPVANGYGLTEAGTAVTLDRNDPPHPETVGTPLPGVEIRIRNSGADGVGEVEVRSKTVMSGYLDDAELTRETIVDGWLRTGDLGALERSGHLRIMGRTKNMIVTAGGKNVYPEDVERAFAGIPVQDACVIAAHVLSPPGMRDERLLLVIGLGPAGASVDEVRRAARLRNHSLPEARRVRGMIVVREQFPRTASLKVKRDELVKHLRQTIDLERDVVDLREP
jgi:long-chain acyl-CoA synthetase